MKEKEESRCFDYEIEEYLPTKDYLKKKYNENKEQLKLETKKIKKDQQKHRAEKIKEAKEKKFDELWKSLKKGSSHTLHTKKERDSNDKI